MVNSPADPLEDVVFDHYQVLSRSDGSRHELGRGAMGITYKAVDTNLQVPVALKVINPQTLNTEAARERFVREARSAAQLRHPHVASVFHLGMEGDAYFYAMEYIAGETVEDLVKRRGPLPPLVALRIATQVARALTAAEGHGLVHRDIKPANLMLVTADEELCVKVIDFGLARSAHETEPGLGFAGTPHFASPEQLESRPTDVRSDIYSLGATLWHMLTGHPPFTGTVEEVMQQHLSEGPPLADLDDLPSPISRLIARMLAKDPAARPQTAADLRRELEACLEESGGGAGLAAAALARQEKEIAAEAGAAAEGAPLADFRTRMVVAGRLEVIERLGETNEGWAFKARDPERGEAVRLLVLRQDFRADPASFTHLENEVQRLAGISHPNLLGIHSLETLDGAGVVAMEWCEGFTLREVLRLHRELSGAEALALVAQMAAGVDHALASDLKRLDLSLHQVFVHFPGLTRPAEEIVRMPLAQWPPFEVKLNPLVLARELGVSETWAGGQTIVGRPVPGGRAPEASAGPAYLRELPVLTYELLGGAMKAVVATSGAARYTPLANLTEEGNEVLRRALDPAQAPASGAAFLRALQEAGQLETRHREIVAPVPVTPQTPARLPAPRRPWLPAALAAGVLVLAGAWFFATRTTAPVPLPPTPPPVARATPGPEPASPPAPDPREQLKAAVAEAERIEETNDLSQALPTWIAVAKSWPDSEVGRMRLELLLDKIRFGQTKLRGAELESALPSLREAAGLEVVSAMLLLGESLRETDPTEAFRWFWAAGAKGVPAALTQMGLMYSNGIGVPRDLAAAVECFDKAAAKGDPAARAALAECYLTAKGVPKDEGKALDLLRQAAAQGNLRAMNRLATCYHQGTGVPKNFPEALRLYHAAADAGSTEAIGNLGVLYINGDGVQPDPQKALELFQKGAASGDGYCMYQYARCLESGTGTAANGPEAETWYKRSAAIGFPRAAEWCRAHGVTWR